MALFGSTSSSTATNTIGNSANDRALSNPPEDSVSDISFSPQADFLAVASWDSKVRIYEIAPTGESQGRAMFEHQGPVLSARWSPDGTKVVSAGCDNAARLYDLQTQQPTQVAVHDAPIKSVRYVDIPGAGSPMIATASWDKTLKYWDTRQQQPISTVTLPERAYTMDTQKDLLVVGTAERHVCIFNLNNPGTIFKSTQSPLKWQTRVISCYPNGGAYAIGSIEGRCGIQYVDDAVNSTKSFLSSVIDSQCLVETSSRSMRSIPFPSILLTTPSQQPVVMAPSTFGTRTLSTGSKALTVSVALLLLLPSTATDRYLHTPSLTTGAKVTSKTPRSSRLRSNSTPRQTKMSSPDSRSDERPPSIINCILVGVIVFNQKECLLFFIVEG